mmetsp:Transcript_11014/g.22162  ORF Transcript_11014/g.22162 Transcript_11014/m.22162 type:complete len:114 (+) Transcript_11014:932-1273(+)
MAEPVPAPPFPPPPPPPPPVLPIPPALAGRGPGIEPRVFRQRFWMERQLRARAEPRPCTYNGTHPCPLCGLTFRIGQELVKCYVVEAMGAPPWVHLDCVNAILVARGVPGLRA